MKIDAYGERLHSCITSNGQRPTVRRASYPSPTLKRCITRAVLIVGSFGPSGYAVGLFIGQGSIERIDCFLIVH